jgi:L-amino acid N-acyltransferase YncA
MAAFRVKPMTAAHAEAVLAIYQDGIESGDATFETEVPNWTAFDAEQ